jgi:hypothetical protein
LRSDIPIFGVAGGKDFKEYRVEYGKGNNPSEWYLIASSTTPQPTTNVGLAEMRLMQGDIDIRGNLATWNTGLKNWVHLPWHPAEDPTDLNGVYTLRLVVFGKDGQTVEDRMTVEVGRAIAQALPGIALSPDKRVVMHFPEQALTYPFRVYTILPLADAGEETPSACENCEYISPVYRIREPSDRFIKNVSLDFTVRAGELDKRAPENVGIGRYDIQENKWVWLDTVYYQQSSAFRTTLNELPAPKAIYALLHRPGEQLSHAAPPSLEPPAPLTPARPSVLVENTFETDLGTFSARDRFVGAALSRDNTVTPDGSYALKFTNENFGGNFSSTILARPFDVREYGTLSFDYRVGRDVKIDVLLKVNGRWYKLIFTGDPEDYRNRDVNIATLGAIQGVIPDDQWHTASVDLRYLLHQQTRHTRVDEIIMADWHVGGYMKLDFGRNPRGATYYLDNFRLTGSGSLEDAPPVLLVDNFNELKGKNTLGGAFGTYGTPGANFVQASLIDAPLAGNAGGFVKTSLVRDGALLLGFDVTKSDAYGGYWTSVAGSELSDYSTLAFRLYSKDKIPSMQVGMRNRQGVEGKADLRTYAAAPAADGWREVRIPLTGLRGLSDFSTPEVVFFSTTHNDGSGAGSLLIDDLRFEKASFARVADFESPAAWTLLGGDETTHENGAAAISAKRMEDPDDAHNTFLRIAYGGTIGRDYGPHGGFSYALWQARLNGIDARQFNSLTLRIRGEKGGETPNFCLSDTATRTTLRATELPAVTQEWQTIRLPLAHYAERGIDLSHLNSLQVVFEWTEQSGTVYVDDIRFE